MLPPHPSPIAREWKHWLFSDCPRWRSEDTKAFKGALQASLPGPSGLESRGPRLDDASINFSSCCFLKDFSSCKDSNGRRWVCSYVGAMSCCFDGAVWLFKAIIKVLYHSLEQQNEFHSRNYCPIIFRIIKAFSASKPLLLPPLFPSSHRLPLSASPLSHQSAHLILRLASAEDAGLFLWGWEWARSSCLICFKSAICIPSSSPCSLQFHCSENLHGNTGSRSQNIENGEPKIYSAESPATKMIFYIRPITSYRAEPAN